MDMLTCASREEGNWILFNQLRRRLQGINAFSNSRWYCLMRLTPTLTSFETRVRWLLLPKLGDKRKNSLCYCEFAAITSVSKYLSMVHEH